MQKKVNFAMPQYMHMIPHWAGVSHTMIHVENIQSDSNHCDSKF